MVCSMCGPDVTWFLCVASSALFWWQYPHTQICSLSADCQRISPPFCAHLGKVFSIHDYNGFGSHGTYLATKNITLHITYLPNHCYQNQSRLYLISHIFREAREPDVLHRHNVQLLQTVWSQVLRHPGTWMCQLIKSLFPNVIFAKSS